VRVTDIRSTLMQHGAGAVRPRIGTEMDVDDDFEDLAYDDIAQVLAISPSTLAASVRAPRKRSVERWSPRSRFSDE
jgi:hypothetical protein